MFRYTIVSQYLASFRHVVSGPCLSFDMHSLGTCLYLLRAPHLSAPFFFVYSPICFLAHGTPLVSFEAPMLFLIWSACLSLSPHRPLRSCAAILFFIAPSSLL